MNEFDEAIKLRARVEALEDRAGIARDPPDVEGRKWVRPAKYARNEPSGMFLAWLFTVIIGGVIGSGLTLVCLDIWGGLKR